MLGACRFRGEILVRRLAVCLIALFALATLTLATAVAEPVGRFKVIGTNPGDPNSRYSGTVVVTRTGETYRVIWQIQGQQYEGTGIGNKEFIAVSYTAGGQSGLAMYGASGNTWRGIWTTAGSTRVGSEVWEP
jgi:hypothetical protein